MYTDSVRDRRRSKLHSRELSKWVMEARWVTGLFTGTVGRVRPQQDGLLSHYWFSPTESSRVTPPSPFSGVRAHRDRDESPAQPGHSNPFCAGLRRERRFLKVFVCSALCAFVAPKWIPEGWSSVSLPRPCVFFQISALFYCLIMFDHFQLVLVQVTADETQHFLILLLYTKNH